VDLDESYTKLNPDVVPTAYATVAVSDNGVGIGASALPDVFEPFFTTKGAGAKAAAPRGSSCTCPSIPGSR
jgi:signal transduction histidine kinase